MPTTTPRLSLLSGPTPVQELSRLRATLGGGPRLLAKRDDAIPFGFGGNKVRKLEFTVAQALAEGADTLVTVGGIQSNHARATAAVAAKLGLHCVLILNGVPPVVASGNLLLSQLLGAEVEYIPSRVERAEASEQSLTRLREEGRNPFFIPLGASTPVGALGFIAAMGELVEQDMVPDVIVHACSSGGTQAGLVAGAALHGLTTRIIGVSADDPAEVIAANIRRIIEGIDRFHMLHAEIEVDDARVGEGYGIPTQESHEAQTLAAQTEALFLDHTYTAKALGAVITYIREGRFSEDETVLFWHTGGQVALFA